MKVQITDKKIAALGQKLNEVEGLKKTDKDLLVATFSLAGEAIKNRETGFSADSKLTRGILDGFKGSVGPQIGGGGDPAALDVGVDVNVNW